MVIPTTAWPWRTSSAATAELSTPPLMATAIGAEAIGAEGMAAEETETEAPAMLRSSGMHRDPAQMRHRGPQRVHQRIHLLGVVPAAEGEPHTGARTLGGKADGGEHVGRRKRARRTGRPCGNGETP